MLTQNYEVHPAFNFSQKPFSIDLNKLETVDLSYQKLTDLKNNVNQSSRDKIKLFEQLKKQIIDVFSDLSLQAEDDFERAFISELEFHCLNLLQVEMEVLLKAQQKYYLSRNDESLESEFKSQYFLLYQLPEAAVSKIQKIAAPHIAKLKKNASLGLITREDLSINNSRFISSIVKVLNKEYGHAGILKAVSAYMGRPYDVGGMALELSVPTSTWWRDGLNPSTKAPSTIYAHLDESKKFPKSIVYLSDVSIDNGPTSFYPRIFDGFRLNALQEIIGRVIDRVGDKSDSLLKAHYSKTYHQSMLSEAFRKHFMRLPPELRFNSHFGWDVMPGGELENAMKSVEQTMLGGAGSCIIFDGARLVHRGGLIEAGERVVLQVIFSPKLTTPHKILLRIMGAIKRIKRVFR